MEPPTLDRVAALFTIGHSKHPAERFARLLAQHDIELLVDVRSVPYSRFSPHFNKAALESAALESSVDYLYLGAELGGRPQEPEFYDSAGAVRYDVLAATDRFRAGLQRLTDEATARRVAIMCAEEDPAKCHRRRLVGHAMRGFELHHIRGDGHVDIEWSLAG